MKIELINSYKQKKYVEAKYIAKKILLTDAKDYEALFYLANSFLFTGEFKSAKDYFQLIIEYYPDKYQGYEGLYKIYKANGDRYNELIQLKKILENFPNVVHIYKETTLLLLQENLINEAENISLECIKKFPDSYHGYESYAFVLEKKQEWEKALEIWNNIIHKFPNFLAAHLNMLKLHVKIYGYERTTSLFESSSQKFKNTEKIDKLYAIEAEKAFKWNDATEIWSRLLSQYPLNTFFVSRKAIALRHVKGIIASREYLFSALRDQPDNLVLKLNILDTYLIEKKWEYSLLYGNDIIKNVQDTAQKSNIYFKLRIPYRELKKLDELENIFLDLIKENPSIYISWKGYATVPELMLDGNEKLLKKACHRWKRASEKFPNIVEAKIKYGEILLSMQQLDFANQVFIELKRDFPNNFYAWKGWCLAAHHMRNWVEARKRLLETRIKFPSQFNSIYYYLVNVLQNDNRLAEIENSFIWHTKSLFKENIKNSLNECLELSKINIYRIIGNYKKADEKALELLNVLPFKDPTTLPKPQKSNISQYIEHSKNNETLVICFSGMDGKRTQNHYRNYGLQCIDKIAFNSSDTYNYQGFANKTIKYNFLLLRDNYNSWYQIHTDYYRTIIENYIKSGNYKKIVLVGASSGGFAAMMYGQLVHADIVYVQAPQTLAFTSYSTQFNKELELQYNLSSTAYTSIAKLQNQSNGFIPKVYVQVCENNGIDMFSINMLNTSDPNLFVHKYKNDTHSVHTIIGKSKMFQDICSIIDDLQK
nr:tetratricopeptide repeat protein [Neisseria meningitidis]